MKNLFLLSGVILLSFLSSCKDKENEAIAPVVQQPEPKGKTEFNNLLLNKWWKLGLAGYPAADSFYYEALTSTSGNLFRNTKANGYGSWKLISNDDYTAFVQTVPANNSFLSFELKIDTLTTKKLTVRDLKNGDRLNLFR